MHEQVPGRNMHALVDVDVHALHTSVPFCIGIEMCSFRLIFVWMFLKASASMLS